MSNGTALVTGAAQGIGKAIALRLADDGFDVAVNDIPTNIDNLHAVVKEIEAKGRAGSAHLADVSVEEEVKIMVEEVVRVYGGMDVMVANAGICKWSTLTDRGYHSLTSCALCPSFTVSVDDFDRQMAINCRGTFLCYKYAGIQMVKQGREGSRIIGACSVAGKRAGSPFLGSYSASKFAVRGLTQAAALELGSYGITVNAYAPGAIDTDMLHYLDTSNAKSTGKAPGTLTEGIKNIGALRTIGTPTDVANLVSFIASKESQFITGQSLSVNGGTFFD
ncbi:acetoin reductase family protein [Mycena metata]|uniref:Acetoin reductase family protein n=1 Tax=Mycena metata TaxID=1033252 RepID=A0AAD7KAQ3_9AGAR|nr:acetoin reductase family protein [Mycena metata]